MSDAEGSAVLHDIPGTGMGTLVAEVAHGHQARGLPVASASVPTRTLSAVCEAHGVTEIHFLKIDVEGAEAAVLHVFHPRPLPPALAVVQATELQSPHQTSALC